MNDYDKAGRYKRDAAGFFRWLLRREGVTFHAWIDTRRHALPDQGDLTNDLVASFRVGDGFEALCVELQAEAASDSAARLLLGYVPRLLTEPAAPDSLALSAAGGAVVNLTGPPQPDRVEQRLTLAPDCLLTGRILQRTLRDEDAGATLREVSARAIPRWLLAWLPLMQGGDEASIIEAWKREALNQPREADQQILAGLTLTFAALAGSVEAWGRALEGFAVIKSPYLEELRERVRTEARAQGLAEGRSEGQAEALRATILELGRQRFRKAATRKQRAKLGALTDLTHLERIRDRLLTAASWTDLLATP